MTANGIAPPFVQKLVHTNKVELRKFCFDSYINTHLCIDNNRRFDIPFNILIMTFCINNIYMMKLCIENV